MLLTGRYPGHGIWQQLPGFTGEQGLNITLPLIPAVLKPAHYSTHQVGKCERMASCVPYHQFSRVDNHPLMARDVLHTHRASRVLPTRVLAMFPWFRYQLRISQRCGQRSNARQHSPAPCALITNARRLPEQVPRTTSRSRVTATAAVHLRTSPALTTGKATRTARRVGVGPLSVATAPTTRFSSTTKPFRSSQRMTQPKAHCSCTYSVQHRRKICPPAVEKIELLLVAYECVFTGAARGRYLALQNAHDPNQAEARFESLYPHVEYQPRQIYLAMAAAVDEVVGNVTTALKAQQLWDNCLLVFSSDNGAPGSGSNFPLRGYK